MSNGLPLAFNFTKNLPFLGHDLKMACTKFHTNWFKIDREKKNKKKIIIIH